MPVQPAQLLRAHVRLLTDNPLLGPILDLACGDGRNGIFLAKHKLPVICCDNSQAALDRARKSAAEQEVTVTVWQVDLEQEGVNPLPDDCYGGVLVFHYLHRPLIPCIKKALKQEGILIYETFTIEQPQFGKPHNPDFLLQPKELYEWFKQWEVMHYFEGTKQTPKERWHTSSAARRHEGELLSKRAAERQMTSAISGFLSYMRGAVFPVEQYSMNQDD